MRATCDESNLEREHRMGREEAKPRDQKPSTVADSSASVDCN